jgi:hypothetical protein
MLVLGSGGIVDDSKGFGIDDNIDHSIQKCATDILWINFIELSLPRIQFSLSPALEHGVPNPIIGNPFSAVITHGKIQVYNII